MPDRSLLQRQSRLLAHLTSGAVIFDGASQRASGLHGFDDRLLRLAAKFSCEKRMEKIRMVLPRTFEALGDSEDYIRRAFVEDCPPADIGLLDNAAQFLGFLRDRRRRGPALPAYVTDIAACELAIAMVRARAGNASEPEDGEGPRPALRRSPGAVLLHCAHDVRPAFEGGLRDEIARRDIRLAIAMPPGGDSPQVSEVSAAVYRVLAALDRWTDPRAIGLAPVLDRLIADLAARGILEVRR